MIKNVTVNELEKCAKIENEFVFGIINQKVEDIIDLPYFSCLVEKSD
jgi:hypothetical protein